MPELIKMKAKQLFSRVLDGQQYYGDPDHPNKENGQQFHALNEGHAGILESEGVASRVRTVEVSDDVTGESQLLVGDRQTDVERAANSHQGEILGAAEKTSGQSQQPNTKTIPQGGLDSTATDNHPLTHTTQTAGNARGTPDPDAPPTGSDRTPSRSPAPRRQPAKSGTKPAGKTAAQKQQASSTGNNNQQGSGSDAAPGA